MPVTLSREGPIAMIKIEHGRQNTYDMEFMQGLDAAINEVRLDNAIQVAVLCSGVPGFFSAGADINMLKASEPRYKATFCLFCQETLNKMERTPKIFIAAIEGHCVGGGLEIALACDLRFMADGRWRIGLPEVGLGVLPGTGGTQRLPRLIGKSRALDMMITGTTVGAKEALEMGLVNRVFPQEDLMPQVQEYARKLTQGAVRAIGLIKLAVNEGLELPLTGGLTLERELQNRLFVTGDAQEGISAFLEKRQAQFQGE